MSGRNWALAAGPRPIIISDRIIIHIAGPGPPGRATGAGERSPARPGRLPGLGLLGKPEPGPPVLELERCAIVSLSDS